MSLSLVQPRPALPGPASIASYRFWERFPREQLRVVRDRIDTVLDDLERQLGLFDAPAAPAQLELAPAPAPAPSALEAPAANPLGSILSPSQANCFLGCQAKWWFKHGAGLPDPSSGSRVRGKVVHKMQEIYFRAKIAGAAIDPDELEQPFAHAWEEEAAKAVFHKDEDPAELKRQAATLTRKYLDEVAGEIQPAAVELKVSGAIAGVPVTGFVDLLDVDGRIVDTKVRAASPSKIDAAAALQLATYRQLAPGANGHARVDTLVATKSPKIVTLPYTVTVADQLMTQHLYPHVREGIREGLYFPNRGSNMCSRKYCNFADACEREFGGTVE